MIALCRAKCFILHLWEESCHIPNAQRGLKGNVIVFLQHPSKLLEVLPPPVEEVVTPICVLFVGSSPPTVEWLRNHVKPLIVRRKKVRSALIWLREHNALYADVNIDHGHLDLMGEQDILPVHIKTVPADCSFHDEATDVSDSVEEHVNTLPAADIFQHVVVTDVDGNAPSHELRAAALHHVKQKGGGFIQVLHGLSPMNEYVNPELLLKIYPTLFPYGLGGFEHPRRTRALSFKRQVKHL
ncbi:hypothetical protein F4604DRAFT_1593031, partial [Suillus subluteus]